VVWSADADEYVYAAAGPAVPTPPAEPELAPAVSVAHGTSAGLATYGSATGSAEAGLAADTLARQPNGVAAAVAEAVELTDRAPTIETKSVTSQRARAELIFTSLYSQTRLMRIRSPLAVTCHFSVR
jgi:hypothetical protein